MCRNDKKGRVLVVDRSEEVRHSLHYALDSSGYEVAACRSGGEALMLVASDDFEFIIMDHDLPDMTGSRLTAELRRIAHPLTVIIGLSGADLGEDLLNAGANDFRRKPFIPYEICMMIDGADLTDPVPVYDHV